MFEEIPAFSITFCWKLNFVSWKQKTSFSWTFGSEVLEVISLYLAMSLLFIWKSEQFGVKLGNCWASEWLLLP